MGCNVSLQIVKDSPKLQVSSFKAQISLPEVPEVTKCESKSSVRTLSEAVSHPTRLWRKVRILPALANVLTPVKIHQCHFVNELIYDLRHQWSSLQPPPEKC